MCLCDVLFIIVTINRQLEVALFSKWIEKRSQKYNFDDYKIPEYIVKYTMLMMLRVVI